MSLIYSYAPRVNKYEYKAKQLEHQERVMKLAFEQMNAPFGPHGRMILLAVGAAFSAGFSAICFSLASKGTRTETTSYLFWKDSTTSEVATSTRLEWLLAGIVLLLIAGALAAASFKRAARQARLKNYPPILTGREVIKIHQISEITGESVRRVYEDLKFMIESGMIEDFYVDYQQEQVVSRKYIPKASYKTVVTCSGCGGNNEVIVGITQSCTFCLEPLVLPTK